MLLANILRMDAAAHRQLPADTELAQAVAVLARAQQNAVWDRTQAANKLTSHLREHFPGFLAAVGVRREGVCHPIARTLLAAAPTPEQAARLTRAQLRCEAGDRHTAAQRTLFNRMLGCLHHCLTRRVCYSETAAFPAPSDAQLTEAA